MEGQVMIVWLIKGASILFLSILAANLWTVARQKMGPQQEQIARNAVDLLSLGYLLAVSLIFWRTYKFEQPLLFAAMLTFPAVMHLSMALFKRAGYQGDIRLLLIIFGLDVISLVFLYRLQVASVWKPAEWLHYHAPVPIAFKDLLSCAAGLITLTLLSANRRIPQILTLLEKNRLVTPLSGILSFVFLLMTKFTGLKQILTASEISFKLLYLIFLSSFFYSIAPRFMIRRYPFREHLRWMIIFILWIAIFFGIPLLIYGEKGTGFLMLLIFFLLTAHFAKDSRFFITGIVSLIVLLCTACVISPDVRRRVFGAWLLYQHYVDSPYFPGETATPGWQLFTALSSIKVSPWGLGLTRGVLTFFHDGKIRTLIPEAVHDFVSVPLAMELGIAIIIIVCASYVMMLKLVPNNYGRLTFRHILATCIAVSLACQGLYNISGSIGLTVMSGLPAPWLSYSGTAMLANSVLAAVLLSILNEREVSTHAEK
jgi:cell division protein FtsW (lipid II flippase)